MVLRKVCRLGMALAVVVTSTLAFPESSLAADVTGVIVKHKTAWGGGWALNIGGADGSTVNGTRAQLFYNTAWDNANGWQYQNPKNGWYMWVNRWSKQCLAVDGAVVAQKPCDPSDNRQYWTHDAQGGGTSWVRNLMHYSSHWNTVLTQETANWDSTVVMRSPQDQLITQQWVSPWCQYFGNEEKEC
ncbi:RICIN domain-containing protein [Kribbella sp. CA-253562]|uniref:RICIN domain-containing protein n=1 Tax=Kribbella sp. CA-253562 TaxID=3239942 RepID=UPI003D8D78C2